MKTLLKPIAIAALSIAMLIPAKAATQAENEALDGLAMLAAYTIACKPDLKAEVYENLMALTKQLPFSLEERRAAITRSLDLVKKAVGKFCAVAAVSFQPALKSLGQ